MIIRGLIIEVNTLRSKVTHILQYKRSVLSSYITTAMSYIKGIGPLVRFLCIGIVVFSVKALESDHEYFSPLVAIDPD